jgi:hypothetical protein
MANEQIRPQSGNSERPTGAIVYVGCKLPSGITLELVQPGKDWNPAPVGSRVTLKGANNVRDPGLMGGSQFEHPYSLTPVDASFWESWMKANKELPFVKNGQVFVVEERGTASAAKERAKAMAKERMSIKTGLEALNPAVDDKGRIKDDRLKSVAIRGRSETAVGTDTDHLNSLMNGMMDAA